MTVPLYWRMQKEKYGLVGSNITGLKGRIISYTIIRAAPEGFEAPYVVGVVLVENGEKLVGEICANLPDVESVSLIDRSVSVVFRRIQTHSNGLRVYGYKFLLE
ncbi:MAG: OB-fold domain-containing protein [Candidatus Aenigmarchaeota archaeon]|nr:OB-fold domain-containing protein [Candidatus Aenigmarchaeota archaeon]